MSNRQAEQVNATISRFEDSFNGAMPETARKILQQANRKLYRLQAALERTTESEQRYLHDATIELQKVVNVDSINVRRVSHALQQYKLFLRDANEGPRLREECKQPQPDPMEVW